VSELYLILSNTGHAAGAKIDKDYKVKTRVACPSSYTGWIRSERLATTHVVFDGDTIDEYERLSETWTLGAESTMSMGPVPLPVVDAYWSGQLAQHDSTVTTLDGPCQSQPVLQTSDASGSGTHLSQLAISEAPGRCRVSIRDGRAGGNVRSAADVLRADVRRNDVDEHESEQDHRVARHGVDVPAAHARGGESGAVPGESCGGAAGDAADGGSDYVDWVVTWEVVRNRR
jgi:hypothetical protein